MKAQRGYAVLAVMAVTTALIVTGVVTFTRAEAAAVISSGSDARKEALWLARSAATRGRAGTWSVPLERETAVVVVRARSKPGGQRWIEAVVTTGRGEARVELTRGANGSVKEWVESFSLRL